ncbi:MAG: hypothetical protein CMD54_04155 [Gammaproteobacteria bacterium]|nr:hypothetical protein [Gammaproteobacteria bacterium]|tara:strand:+ start:1011 stop:1475 length:465 start_codon:yes stop_codon:yes gene_type:complete
METKKKSSQISKIILVGLSSCFTTSTLLAIDFESIYSKHADHCMDQIAEENRNFFERLFSSKKISEKCVLYSANKTKEEFDAAFFEKKITDQEYRRVLNLFETFQNEGISDDISKITNSAVDSQTMITGQGNQDRETLPTARGFKSIGPKGTTK